MAKGGPETETGFENLPSPEEAASLLFSMFGDVRERIGIPEITQRLLAVRNLLTAYNIGEPRYVIEQAATEGYYFYKEEMPFFASIGHTTTENFSANSPVIRPDNVCGAEKIITVTTAHHNLGWGPQKDIVFALGEQGREAFVYTKRNHDGVEGGFDKLGSWGKVREILTVKEKRESGVLLEIWKRAGQNPFYTLLTGIRAGAGVSLEDLLIELKKDIRK